MKQQGHNKVSNEAQTAAAEGARITHERNELRAGMELHADVTWQIEAQFSEQCDAMRDAETNRQQLLTKLQKKEG